LLALYIKTWVVPLAQNARYCWAVAMFCWRVFEFRAHHPDVDRGVERLLGMSSRPCSDGESRPPSGCHAVDDIDFFPCRTWALIRHAEKALDAPIDIWMMSAKFEDPPAEHGHRPASTRVLGQGHHPGLDVQGNNGFIPTASDADTSVYDVLTQKAVTIVQQRNKITQFHGSRLAPDFAGANGMQSFLLTFLNAPQPTLRSFRGRSRPSGMPFRRTTPPRTEPSSRSATPTPAAS